MKNVFLKSPIFFIFSLIVAFFLLGWIFYLSFSQANFLYRLQRASVLIECDGYGTGVLVSRKNADGHHVTYVWTAAHVTSIRQPIGPPAAATNVIVWIGREKWDASVVDYSSHTNGVDIALLRIWQEDVSKSSVTFACDTPPNIGTRVWHIGNFYGDLALNSLSTGIVSALNRTGGDEVYDQMSCPVYPGSSGGGFYLDNGQCIGLADARIGESLVLIVPAREIRKWAKFRGLEWAL